MRTRSLGLRFDRYNQDLRFAYQGVDKQTYGEEPLLPAVPRNPRRRGGRPQEDGQRDLGGHQLFVRYDDLETFAKKSSLFSTRFKEVL